MVTEKVRNAEISQTRKGGNDRRSPEEMMAVNFKTWLLQQVDRDDPIGDLARDLRDDSTAGAVSTTRFETTYQMCDDARRALKEARREYTTSVLASTL